MRKMIMLVVLSVLFSGSIFAKDAATVWMEKSPVEKNMFWAGLMSGMLASYHVANSVDPSGDGTLYLKETTLRIENLDPELFLAFMDSFYRNSSNSNANLALAGAWAFAQWINMR